MKNAESKTTKIGNEQSAKATDKTGPSPMTESKEKGCGEIIVGIERIGDLIGRSISTTLDYIRLYGMPAEKKEAVWQIDIEKFKSWAAALGWTRQMSETELGIQVRKKNLMEAGPGEIVEARSLDALATRLFSDVGRLQSCLKWTDCPIQKNDDGTYQVDLNRWELFQIQHRIGEYRLTGNQKGRISWTC